MILVSDMSDKIRHPGVVSSTAEGCVCVRILQTSACAGCKVASRCNASETKEKMVYVDVDDSSAYAVGDSVVVVADAAVGLRASFYAYLLPLVLMVVALVAVVVLTDSEGAAAFAAIGVLIPYYWVLYVCRDRMRRTVRFEIMRRVDGKKIV